MKVGQLLIEIGSCSDNNIHAPYIWLIESKINDNFWLIEGDQAVCEQIAEMRATWQDPVAEASSGWDEPAATSGWNDAEVESSVTDAQIEAQNSQQQAANQQDGDPNIIRCIAFYPYEVSPHL